MPFQKLDKVYFPVAETTKFVLCDDKEGIGHCYLFEQKDMLVMTQEDLKAIVTGYAIHLFKTAAHNGFQSFDDYMNDMQNPPKPIIK